MSRNWTEAQKAAIETTGTNILVSAGAGSGKTAVLTERIIRKLTDPENPGDILRMLVVTYTKAAAAELKERISDALREAIAKDPANKHLSRQLLHLDRAKISTIHSFCLDLLQEGIGDEDIPFAFRIADEVEVNLLRRAVMDELIDDYYSCGVSEYEIEDFPQLVQTFISSKTDDSLADFFLGIEGKLSSFTENIEFIKNFASELSETSCPFGESACGKEILDLVAGKIKLYRDKFAKALPQLQNEEHLQKSYLPACTDDIDYIDRLIYACSKYSYADVSAIICAYSPTPLSSVKKEFVPLEIENIKKDRKKFKEQIDSFQSDYFSLDESGLEGCRIDTASTLLKLYSLLAAFRERFSAEKRRRSILDFVDLEHFAYKMLVSDGQPTEIAKQVSERFDEIYIDEYQDANAIQDAIFKAISNGHNRFMVGDIKQSIYSFRGAEPQIFADYRKAFTAKNPEKRSGKAIFLSNNFRCDDPVIKFTNIVSGCLFTSGRGDIPFTNDDMLVHSKIDTECGEPVHIVLINSQDCEDSSDALVSEAEYVADEISRLLHSEKKNNGEKFKPSDIAVIMRSDKGQSQVIGNALRARGIPYYTKADGDFFANAEVLLALCILNIIDNPTRDIYLAGALRSPVYNLTLDELSRIRSEYSDGCLYEALREYCKNHDFPKGREFLASLDEFRLVAEGLPVDKLLWHVYTKTDMLALVYDKENSLRRANLMMLYEYAIKFEASSFKGLHNFIRYINDVLDAKATFKNAKDKGEASDTVKLISAHHSKGLEFPACFIFGAAKKFNTDDIKNNVIIERNLGIAMKLSDTSDLARYDTPIRRILINRMCDSVYEEEMRILYVAMTRARERLYITALTKDHEALCEQAALDAASLSRYTVMNNVGFIRWILTAIKHHEMTDNSKRPYVIDTVVNSPTKSDNGAAEIIEEATPVQTVDDEMRSFVHERMDFVYPYEASSRLPAKLSVSKLLPNLLDADTAELDFSDDTYIFSKKRPLFLDAQKAAPTASGAERGSATHLFMQFCDFTRFNVSPEELMVCVENEAGRLAKSKFITARMASLVNVRQITRFFASDTYKEILNAKNVWREHRFNVRLPAKDFTEDAALAAALGDQTLLVQGVIDCFYENPDGTITLIDYKTDYIPPELDFDAACSLLLERHRAQLMYYKAACEKISAKKVSRTAIYSFALGCTVEVEHA